MLLPMGITPENSLYFIGAKIIECIHKHPNHSVALVSLIEQMHHEIGLSAALTSLGLDWLYLLDTVRINNEGNVILCS